MIRWGIIDKKSADKYGASYDSMEFDPTELEGVDLSDKEITLGINVTAEELDKEFEKYIGAYIPNYVWKSFSKYVKIDPETYEPVEEEKGTGKPSLLITPKHLNLPKDLCNITPNKQLENIKNGKKYKGPLGWMKRFRKSLDNGLSALNAEINIYNLPFDAYKKLAQKGIKDPKIDKYLLDAETISQFANLRDKKSKDKKNAVVPCLGFCPLPAVRSVLLRGSYPAFGYAFRGGVPALGRFLS